MDTYYVFPHYLRVVVGIIYHLFIMVAIVGVGQLMMSWLMCC